MLLKEIDKPFNDELYLFEPKYDGIRVIIYADLKKVIIKNRYNLDVTRLYPELQNIKKVVKGNTIFDGEIVALEHGKPTFSKIQERLHLLNDKKIAYYSNINPVTFIAFDILYEQKSLINKPLIDRKKILDTYLNNDYFIKSFWLMNDGKKLFKTIKKLKLEGIVAKLKDSIYEIDTRSNNWLKIKNWQKGNFIIGGYQEKSENLSLYLGEFIQHKLQYVGKVSIRKDDKLSQKILKIGKVKSSPFYKFNNDLVNFIKPELKITVKYLEKTTNNHLRQPFVI